MPGFEHKRIEQPGPHNGRCYVSKDCDRNRYIPTQFEKTLEDHDSCRRADHTEHPADGYFMNEQPIKHDAGRMRFRHSTNLRAHSKTCPVNANPAILPVEMPSVWSP